MYIRGTFYGMIERRRAITCGCAYVTAGPCQQCRDEARKRRDIKRALRLSLPHELRQYVTNYDR